MECGAILFQSGSDVARSHRATHGNTVPYLNRNTFGGTLGGPIKKNKLFFFASYQGQRATDQDSSFSEVSTLPGLTDNNRDAASLAALADASFNPKCGTAGNPACLTASSINPVALNIVNLKSSNGRFLIPSETITDPAQQTALGYNAFVVGPNTTFKADQVNGNIDYNFSARDRLAAKYYFQNDPTFAPFAISQVGNFPQQLSAGSQTFSVENTVTVSPNAVWTQRFGFIREKAFAHTTDEFSAADYGTAIFNLPNVPGISITTPNPNFSNGVRIGPASNFADAGIFQNDFEASTKYSWTVGRHTLAFGFQWNHSQLNVINKNDSLALLNFSDFSSFLQGDLCTPNSFFCGETGASTFVNGESNRYFRANQIGTFAADTFRLKSNLTVTLGLRWDWNGALTEKNGRLANFYPQDYSYDYGTDTIGGIGIVVAGNNRQFGTKGVSDSMLTGRSMGRSALLLNRHLSCRYSRNQEPRLQPHSERAHLRLRHRAWRV